MSLLWVLLAKEARLHWRDRARVSTALFFGVMVVLLLSFAVGPNPALLARLAGGFWWLALLFASTLQLGAAASVELDNDAQDGLRMAAVPGPALFLAKACMNAATLLLMALVFLPVSLAIYGVALQGSLARLALVLGLGVAAIAAPGTLYAALTSRVRGGEVLLPLLLLPLLTPSILAAVKASTLLIEGDPMGQLAGWLWLLFLVNALFWPLAALLYGRVVEE